MSRSRRRKQNHPSPRTGPDPAEPREDAPRRRKKRAAEEVAPPPASFRGWDRAAAFVLALYVILLSWVAIAGHPTPLYTVETDLIGEYIPAAQSLRAGELKADHYGSKGFGYPLALAATSFLTRSDYYLAARVLNVAGAVAGGLFAYLLFRAFFGGAGGLFVLLGLIANPHYYQAAVEAGTDTPTFALSIAATFLVLWVKGARARFAAGLIAGFAFVTRYNSVFLVPAGLVVLVARRERVTHMLAYAAGVTLTAGAWLVSNWVMSGNPLSSQNYLNVAYEIYGRSMNSELFWSGASSRFHSLGDVIRHDPGQFVSRIAVNLATRWVRDAHRLMPWWIGMFAVPGMLWGWFRRPGWPGMALHFGLCYLLLATVFYLPRFSLYLIPFYLSGVVALGLTIPLGRRASWRPPWAAPSLQVPGALALRAAVLVALFSVSASISWNEENQLLAKAPHEVRVGGALLRKHARPGERVISRKPHVAYFAGLQYTPFPEATSFEELIKVAREIGVSYLFMSSMEASARPQFAVLFDPAVRLPGMEQVAYDDKDPRHAFVIYRFTGEPVRHDSMQVAVLEALRRFTRRRPGQALPRTLLGSHLVGMNRFAEALDTLAVAEQMSPRDIRIARMQSMAHYGLHQYDEAVRACRRAIELGSNTAWEHASLGLILLMQGRNAEARGELEIAARWDPSNAFYTQYLGLADLELGNAAAAEREFAKAAPSRAGQPLSLEAARAWLRLGQPQRALRALEEARGLGAAAPMAALLADSIRARLRPK